MCSGKSLNDKPLHNCWGDNAEQHVKIRTDMFFFFLLEWCVIIHTHLSMTNFDKLSVLSPFIFNVRHLHNLSLLPLKKITFIYRLLKPDLEVCWGPKRTDARRDLNVKTHTSSQCCRQQSTCCGHYCNYHSRGCWRAAQGLAVVYMEEHYFTTKVDTTSTVMYRLWIAVLNVQQE